MKNLLSLRTVFNDGDLMEIDHKIPWLLGGKYTEEPC